MIVQKIKKIGKVRVYLTDETGMFESWHPEYLVFELQKFIILGTWGARYIALDESNNKIVEPCVNRYTGELLEVKESNFFTSLSKVANFQSYGEMGEFYRNIKPIQ